jgi:hypothetical protein
MERVSGTVTRVKGQGFQLEGHNGTWFNVSKFAEGVEVPAVGASVAVDLDGKGFVRRVETAGAPVCPIGGSGGISVKTWRSSWPSRAQVPDALPRDPPRSGRAASG